MVEGSRARNHGGRFRCAYSADRQGLPEAPPIPDKFVDPAGAVVFTADDVIAGQQVFLKHGLIDNGTIWGHGGYLGPDFSAQSLHILALDLADRIARERLNRGYTNLTPEEKAAVEGAVALVLKANRYDPASGT